MPTDDQRIFVPSEKSVAEATKPEKGEQTPKHHDLPQNLAGEFDVVKKFQELANEHYTHFLGQSSRKELVENLRDSDAKWRMSNQSDRRYSTGSAQKQDTLSQVCDPQFHQTVRLIANGQKSIIFSDDDDLPARFEPVAESDDYGPGEGKRIAEGRNLYLRHVWSKEGWTQAIKNGLEFLQKNNMELYSLEWEKRTDTRKERVPGYYEKDGTPKELKRTDIPPEKMYDKNGEQIGGVYSEDGTVLHYVFADKTRVIRNCPVLMRHDFNNTFLDLDIRDIQKQQAVLHWGEATFSDLIQMQKDGYYVNVGRVGTDHLSHGETYHAHEVRQDQDDNANEDRDTTPNGNVEIWRVRMIAPIDESGKTPKWDEDAVPHIYEGVFAGRVDDIAQGEPGDGDKQRGAVCLELRKLRYHHNRWPYFMWFSHNDDRGNIRIGLYQILESVCEEIDVTLNQWLDNKSLAIKSPFVGQQGALLSRNLKFDMNKVFWTRAGFDPQKALQKLDIPDMTQRLVQEIAMLRETANNAVGTLDAYRGEFAGSRTTASEYMGARAQAMMPAIEDAKFVAEPFLQWLLQDFADLTMQFADPKEYIAVTNSEGDLLGRVAPAELYGEYKAKVVAIEKFQTEIQVKQLLINFISSGAYDRAAQIMGPEGTLYFWRLFAKYMRLPESTKLFPGVRRYVEAERQAWSDLKVIQTDPARALSDEEMMPQPGEMHDVHLGILTPYRDRLTALIPAYQDEEERANAQMQLQALTLYITMHEQLKQQEAGAQAGAQAGMGAQAGVPENQSASPPPMGGEAAGDMIAGISRQSMGGTV